jgi:hypothetical protein
MTRENKKPRVLGRFDALANVNPINIFVAGNRD